MLLMFTSFRHKLDFLNSTLTLLEKFFNGSGVYPAAGLFAYGRTLSCFSVSVSERVFVQFRSLFLLKRSIFFATFVLLESIQKLEKNTASFTSPDFARNRQKARFCEGEIVGLCSPSLCPSASLEFSVFLKTKLHEKKKR